MINEIDKQAAVDEATPAEDANLAGDSAGVDQRRKLLLRLAASAFSAPVVLASLTQKAAAVS
jgi:hypothetical protein